MVKAYWQIDRHQQSSGCQNLQRRVVHRGSKLAEDVGVMPTIPHNAGRMQYRTNTPAHTAEEYFKCNLTIPLVDHLLVELDPLH